MTKVKFVYIGREENYRIPKVEFNALELSKKDKKTLYPTWSEEKIKNTQILYPQTDTCSDNEVFVYGIGRKKFGKTNKVVVPCFSGELEDWDSYIKDYGIECLFYSLTGYSLHSIDCCSSKYVSEFYSLLRLRSKGGIRKYQKFVDAVIKIQDIQREKLTKMFSYKDDWALKNIIKENTFYPCFRILCVVMPPYLDTPTDDDKLERIYRMKRLHEITINHPSYNELTEVDAQRKAEFEKKGRSFEYKELSEVYCKINKKIKNDILETLKNEIETDDRVFPVSMSDRLKMLYGEECNRLYDYILSEFKD